MAALLSQRASSTLAATRAARPSKAVMAPRAALMSDVKLAKASRKSSNPKPAGFELGFTKDNEVFVGRLAMMGFASSVVGEVLSGGQGALAQLSYLYSLPEAQVGIFLAGLVAFNLVAGLLPTSGTFKPEEVAAREAEEGPIKNPNITLFQVKKFFGVTDWGFTAQNELFAGRMAQLGFAASLIGEVLTGMGPLGQFSAETGIPVQNLQFGLVMWAAFMACTAVDALTGKKSSKKSTTTSSTTTSKTVKQGTGRTIKQTLSRAFQGSQ